jgi:ribosomal protein S18 acetylase RimI-like enzyme
VDPSGVTVRPIARRDIPEFRLLLDSVCRERRYLAFLRAPDLASVRDYVGDRMRKKDVQIVAERDGSLVGWCDVAASDLPGFTHTGRLGMGVLAACRGRGIGTRLLEEALRRARENGLLRVELEVFASNAAAVRLYRRRGFRVEGRKPGARFLDGRFDDVLIMGLGFTPATAGGAEIRGTRAAKTRPAAAGKPAAAPASPRGGDAKRPRGESGSTASRPAGPPIRPKRRKGKG